ncbi:MAG: DUF1905 domain-containing protein [Bacteroidota bacterium]
MKSKKTSKQDYRFTSILERSDNKLWGAHFRVPVDVEKKLIDKKSRRVICTLNGKEEYQCAILRYRTRLPVISVNTGLRKKLRLDLGSEVDVVLRKDRSEYGLPLPEELRELFRQDKEGSELFHGLTRGKQRTLLYIVGHAKSPDKRVEQSIIIVRHLKANKGKIDYKQLSASLRSPRSFT